MPIPNSSAYLGQQALAQQAYDNAIISNDRNRGLLNSRYGLTDSGTLDPNNPYGIMQRTTMDHTFNQRGFDLDAADIDRDLNAASRSAAAASAAIAAQGKVYDAQLADQKYRRSTRMDRSGFQAGAGDTLGWYNTNKEYGDIQNLLRQGAYGQMSAEEKAAERGLQGGLAAQMEDMAYQEDRMAREDYKKDLVEYLVANTGDQNVTGAQKGANAARGAEVSASLANARDAAAGRRDNLALNRDREQYGYDTAMFDRRLDYMGDLGGLDDQRRGALYDYNTGMWQAEAAAAASAVSSGNFSPVPTSSLSNQTFGNQSVPTHNPQPVNPTGAGHASGSGSRPGLQVI